LNPDRVLNKKAAAGLSRYLLEYSEEQGVYMKINFVNPDHVHALIDIPTGLSIAKVVQLLKGSSAHWVNANELLTGKFAWARGYGAFSASHSNVDLVALYIVLTCHVERSETSRIFRLGLPKELIRDSSFRSE
jgi:REP element-mobilizing transposase RayT